jgi:hypothetical protein
MPLTLPDKGEGQNDVQSILFQEYLDAIMDGISGSTCVLAGCVVSAQGTPNMTVQVSKGTVLSNRAMRGVAANASLAVGAANATHPRIDLVVVNSAGALAVRAGTAAAAPKPPARSAGDVTLAALWVPANDTTLSNDQITDLRVVRDGGPICIYMQTAVDTVNNTASAIELLNRAGGGVTIPNGLLLAGRNLRIRAGGNFLINSGTPTVRLAVAYGGTTLFSDISGAGAADTDRSPWALDLNLTAQANNDQALTGVAAMGIIATKTAPATGRGDAWSTASNINPIAGSAAVDSDAADCVLSIQATFSVANAANEWVTEFVSIEWC